MDFSPKKNIQTASNHWEIIRSIFFEKKKKHKTSAHKPSQYVKSWIKKIQLNFAKNVSHVHWGGLLNAAAMGLQWSLVVI